MLYSVGKDAAAHWRTPASSEIYIHPRVQGIVQLITQSIQSADNFVDLKV